VGSKRAVLYALGQRPSRCLSPGRRIRTRTPLGMPLARRERRIGDTTVTVPAGTFEVEELPRRRRPRSNARCGAPRGSRSGVWCAPRAAADRRADRLRGPGSPIGVPRHSGEGKREHEIVAPDRDLDSRGASADARVGATSHPPQARRRASRAARKSRPAPGLAPVVQPRPPHGEPSTWLTNTADPPPSSRACSAIDIVLLLRVKTRSPGAGCFAAFRIALRAEPLA